MSDNNNTDPATVNTGASDGSQVAPSRRSSEREVVSYLGIAMIKNKPPIQVNLIDLSAEGARLIADVQFKPEGEFILKVPETGAGFVSEVVWQENATYGVRFLRPSGA